MSKIICEIEEFDHVPKSMFHVTRHMKYFVINGKDLMITAMKTQIVFSRLWINE